MKRTHLYIQCLLVCIAAVTARSAQAAAPPWLDGYQLRYTMRVMSDLGQSPPHTVVCALPAGSWIADPETVAVQSENGDVLPVRVMAHDDHSDTIVQFPRLDNVTTYYAYILPKPNAESPKPTVAPLPDGQMREGMFGQVRHWDGPSLDSWADVRAGLVAGQVQAHAVVGEMMHYSNPADPQRTDHFAISYRGYLQIETPGEYRLAANGDQATFLFVDGELVHAQPGPTLMLTSGVDPHTFGVALELSAGAHSIEYHQALGAHVDTPRDRPAGAGALLWLPPGEKSWLLTPRRAFAAAAHAEAVELERADQKQAAGFTYGMQDYLAGDGFDIYLARFEATGAITDETKLKWDFGDGQTAVGRAVTHVYFSAGEFTVTLTGGDNLPPHRRRVVVWTRPYETSPLSLGVVVDRLAQFDLAALDPVQLGRVFAYLTRCEQPSRWPVLEKVARHALDTEGLDIDFQGQLYEALITSMAKQNRAREAVALADETAKRFEMIDSFAARIMLAGADVQRDHGGDLRDAVTRYQAILERYRRLEAPVVREAAIHLGDLYARTGDLDAATQTYEAAASLGGRGFSKSANAAAVDRGTMLRIVEDKLASGETRIAQRLLTRIELDHPQQKLEGYYQLLTGEVDRAAGRYEEALRAYELILAFPQWAGLRDQAMHGAAVCRERLAQYEQALHWLLLLEAAEPLYFEKHDLAKDRQRIERMQAADGGMFSGLSLAFEQDEADTFAPLTSQQALGIDGPRALQVWGGRQKVLMDLNVPLTGIESNETYWVSLWCRHNVGNLAQSGQPTIQATIAQGNPSASLTLEPWPVWGQWLHLGGSVTATDRKDPKLRVTVQQFIGMVMLDGLRMQPVTPRQRDALLNFTQGAIEP